MGLCAVDLECIGWTEMDYIVFRNKMQTEQWESAHM